MATVAINLATGSLQQEEIIVGIDLGTTNSLVAYVHPETRQPAAINDLGYTQPTAVQIQAIPMAMPSDDEAAAQTTTVPTRTPAPRSRSVRSSTAFPSRSCSGSASQRVRA